MKNILLIATGGTIASKDNGNGLTPSIDVNVLLDYIPVIRQKCHVTGISLMNIDLRGTPDGAEPDEASGYGTVSTSV